MVIARVCIQHLNHNGLLSHALQIPDMLGIVLSSSKYGVRQARGKYGMGAKMALIWSKKSTGLPIQASKSLSSIERSAEAISHIPFFLLYSQGRVS